MLEPHLDLIACGKLDTEFMLTHESSLDEILDAYDIFEGKKDHVIKIAVTP